MREAVERQFHAVEQPARLHHGNVECLPVVGHEQIGIVEEVRDRRQERPFGAIAGEEELTDLEGVTMEEMLSWPNVGRQSATILLNALANLKKSE